jgi:hypothetical protein
MNRYQTMALHCSIALLLVAGGLFALAWHQHQTITPAAVSATTSIAYGTNGTYMVAAVRNIWPQENGPYCALATGMAVVNYIDEEDHLPMRFTSPSEQYVIAKANQTSGESRWGYAKPTTVSAGITNIAPDKGVDPRGAAYMQNHYAPPGTIFHDYIYRWTFHYHTEPPYHWQVMQATTSLFRAWLSNSEPMSVIINGGEHSVIVSGGWSVNSIATNYPANIQGVIVRDPEFAPSISRFEMDFDQWSNHGAYFGSGYYTLWARYYGQNLNLSVNTDDPEPTVGIYRPTKTYPDHWFQGFTWITRDDHTANGASSPDWAYTDRDVLLTTP